MAAHHSYKNWDIWLLVNIVIIDHERALDTGSPQAIHCACEPQFCAPGNLCCQAPIPRWDPGGGGNPQVNREEKNQTSSEDQSLAGKPWCPELSVEEALHIFTKGPSKHLRGHGQVGFWWRFVKYLHHFIGHLFEKFIHLKLKPGLSNSFKLPDTGYILFYWMIWYSALIGLNLMITLLN